MPPTPQQSKVISHDPAHHGLVIAGPGTGKSWTAIELLRRISEEYPDFGVGLLTFTRAATGELLKKVGAQGMDSLRPSTLHAFALRLLMRHAAQSKLALPLRLPDTWESKELIRKDLARRLRDDGHSDVDAGLVEALESEMAAQWESLDPNYVNPRITSKLRNAYLGHWNRHRTQFGYALFAEIPRRAHALLEDHTPDLGGLRFLVVDEYQDLNRSDIRLLEQLAERGVALLAIGDDDQSIYGFRMAAPEGIREFGKTFRSSAIYPLTTSMRCAEAVLAAATALIETAPGRMSRPPLTSGASGAHGTFAHIRFDNADQEADGIAEMIAHRIKCGVAPRDIAVLVRSGVRSWAEPMAAALQARGIAVADTDWVGRALGDTELRRVLAIARLAEDRSDSLAWWALCKLASGVSDDFVAWVAAGCGRNESFAERLQAQWPNYAGWSRGPSAKNAAKLVSEMRALLDGLSVERPASPSGWGAWVAGLVGEKPLSTEASKLLDTVGCELAAEERLAGFLSQLEPVGKDIAQRADAVRIMTMASSKGLTVDSAFVVGVEEGVVPHPKAGIDEERRLLYVAMTRATTVCVLSSAKSRVGATARRGTGQVFASRGRCPLLDGLPIGAWTNGNRFVREFINRA